MANAKLKMSKDLGNKKKGEVYELPQSTAEALAKNGYGTVQSESVVEKKPKKETKAETIKK